MAEQALVQFQVDKKLKQEVSDIYQELGVDLPTAFRMFMVKTKKVNGFPFSTMDSDETITLEEGKKAFYELKKQAADLPEMTLDEINAEIAAARAERKAKRK